MSKKEVKTNAMRMLDRAKVSYTYEEYECDDFTDGIQTADKLGYDHKLVYKTLVTTGKTGNHYVIQEDAKELEYMHVSGGKLGMQIRLAPLDLQKVAKAEFADVIRP